MSQGNSKPRLLLMGCGSVGGVIAAGLIKAGRDLTLITHNDAISQAIQDHGLKLITPGGPLTVPATAHTDIASVAGPFDIVLLAMKATDVEQAVRDVKALISSTGYVVTLQNGVVEDRVGEILGRERVIGALVGWGATMHSPGVCEMTSRGELMIGELDGTLTPRVRQLKSLLDTATPTNISDNIYGALWSKLAINCVVTTLGAVTGQTLGTMLKRHRVRRLALAITSEVVDVAKAHHLQLEPVGGTLDIHRLYVPSEDRFGGFRLGAVLQHAIILAVGIKFRRLRSSMLQSIERGRRPEIDFMNGYVGASGREVGVETPVNAALTTMVREIEAGVRTPSPQNLDAIVRQVR